MRRDDHEQNRRSWNAATRAHLSHKRDEAAFLRDGGSTLFDEELALLGPLAGRDVLHLQCNAGQDTLSLAARGACVHGVDISDTAIEHARRLAEASGIPGTFERVDVYDWLASARDADRRWDLAFVSYGALPWLSDLRAWASGVGAVLRPGGALVVVEFHPVALMFDEAWRPRWPHGGGARRVESDGVPDYVAGSGDGLTPSGREDGVETFDNPEPSVEYAWSVGDVLAAIAEAGLRLTRFHEYPHVNGCAMWDGLVPDGERRFRRPATAPEIPLMFGLRAESR